MKQYLKFLLLLLLITGFNGAEAQTTGRRKPATIEKELDALFAKAIVDYNVPGMAVAIIKDGNVLLSKGYGVKNSLGKAPVDDKTLFAIASNSKAFTAAALAILVDEGKIKWSDKVRAYLPYFEMYSPYVSQEMTIRDLLTHRTGLATFSGDLIWYGSSHSREEVIRRAKYLQPVCGFREAFGYSNIMYLAAGQIIEKVSGITWDDFIKEKIFMPLGMTESNSSINHFKKGANLAIPHNEIDGKNVPIKYINWDNINAAGSINSSVSELTQWMKLQLGKGTLDGKKFWSEQRTYEMWENITPLPVGKWQRENMPSRHFNGYGLGWNLMEYGGKRVVNHDGGYDGMISKTVLVPEINLGFVILTNNINSLPSALAFDILDEFLGVKENQDWTSMFLKFKKEDEAASIESAKQEEESRIKNTQPSLALKEYAGNYRSEIYGDVIVSIDNDEKLLIDFKPTALFKGELRHWHYDTFQLSWTTEMKLLPKGKATFALDAKGIPNELKIVVDNPDFDFTELRLLRVTETK